MEENKETKETKKLNIVPIAVIVVGVLLLGVGAFFMLNGGNKDAQDKEKEKESTKDEHNVSEDVVKKLSKVAFLNDDSTTYSSPLDDVNGNIDEESIAKKVEIVVNYAKENGLATEEKDSSKCVSGTGTCNSLTVENYKKVIKLYGLNQLKAEEDPSIKLDNNKYYFRAAEKTVKYQDVMHSLFSMKLLDEIIINDNIHIMNINPENEEINDQSINKEYTFRKIDDTDEYYLYSVRDNSVYR